MPLPATQPRGATRPKHHEMHYILDCRMAMSLRPGLYSNSVPEVNLSDPTTPHGARQDRPRAFADCY
jgi:hypothetical protein